MKKLLSAVSLLLALVMLLSTFASCEAEHVHKFDKTVQSAEYLKTEGSCKQKTAYYYSCECGEKGANAFVLDYVHDFTEKRTTAPYFAEEATEKALAKYYYSCKNCDAKSEQTFEHGKKDSERAAVGSKAAQVLNGKKILISGCSYNFYGKIVTSRSNTTTDLATRLNDKGYFYELCKQNGAEVNVTNWCFGNHDLKDLFSNGCNADRQCGNGFDHVSQLTDRYYDYVSLMDIDRPKDMTVEQYLEELKGYMKLFTDVNPDCKFIYSLPCGSYWYEGRDKVKLNDLYLGSVFAKEVAKLENVIVMDWGRLIYDLLTGAAKVPGSELTYNVHSFIIDDGYHPNLLTGYINALMTYCVLTGETAVGQPIDLENGLEPGSATKYKKSNFISNFYKENSTNFLQILGSETEMRGIQRLVDRYIDMNTYLYY